MKIRKKKHMNFPFTFSKIHGFPQRISRGERGGDRRRAPGLRGAPHRRHRDQLGRRVAGGRLQRGAAEEAHGDGYLRGTL